MNRFQLRMGRAVVGWSIEEMAKRAETAPETIAAIEGGDDASLHAYERSISALEKAGVTFLADDGNGFGVRLKDPSQPKHQRTPTLARRVDPNAA